MGPYIKTKNEDKTSDNKERDSYNPKSFTIKVFDRETITLRNLRRSLSSKEIGTE